MANINLLDIWGEARAGSRLVRDRLTVSPS
jgi:hypothetical protein